jgi:hypothetical protein
MISAGGSERETHNRPFELEEASRTKPGFNSEGLTQQTLPPQCLGYAPHPSMGKEIPKGFQFQGIAGQASTPSQHGYGRRNPHGRATVSVGAAMSSPAAYGERHCDHFRWQIRCLRAVDRYRKRSLPRTCVTSAPNNTI